MKDYKNAGGQLKRAVVDASSAIILFKAGLFLQLMRTYQVLMTESVHSEVTLEGYPGAEFFREVRHCSALTIVSCNRSVAQPFTNDPRLDLLDLGERDAIACLICRQADFIIIDDGRGSSFCRDNNLPFINALLFPKLLFLNGRFSTAVYEEKTAKIMQYGRYSQRIIEFAGAMGLKELKPFLP